MNTSERDKRLREVAAELKRIQRIPIRTLPEDAHHQIITARNMLKAVAPSDTKQEIDKCGK